jgi:hypothetical protein
MIMVENHLDIGGGVVFWSLAEWSDRFRLRSGLELLGLEAFMPDPRQPPAALREALEDVFGEPRVLVRPLASKDGFAVVREERGLSGNRYNTELTARVIGDPASLTFDPWDSRAQAVELAYQTQLGRVSASQLSFSLVKVVEYLGGTRLRPSGAVYWIPGPKLEEWSDVAQAVEQAADTKKSAVYLLRHRLDADAVRAVRDALVAEVRDEAGRIKDEVLSGDLGGRALVTRKNQVVELRSKVLLYEELLNVGLKGLHKAIDEADQAAVTAAILLSGVAPDLTTSGAG